MERLIVDGLAPTPQQIEQYLEIGRGADILHHHSHVHPLQQQVAQQLSTQAGNTR